MKKIQNLICFCLKGQAKRIMLLLNISMIFLFYSMPLSAQQVTVSGKVTDGATGDALAGVTIQVQGTLTGTISQPDGTYSVNVPVGSNTLIFSFIGYETQNIEVAGRTVIDVTMTEEITALEEVVITGYSTERKKDIIGSVAVVETDNLVSLPSGSLSNKLQGRASGLIVNSQGNPGEEARLRVRGFGSFGDSSPLVIIDGVAGDLSRVNPNDVESVQVLKDAASSAVYGARAANGVIIVTTKQGQAGAVKISLDAYAGTSFINQNQWPEMLNAQEWGELYWKGLEGAGRSVGDANWGHPQYGDGATPVIPEYILVTDGGIRYGGTQLAKLKTSDPTFYNYLVDPANYSFENHQIVKPGDTDWIDETFNPAPIQNYQLTVSGGADRSSFLISLNYYDEQSTATKYSVYKRYSLRSNSSFNVTDYLRIGENLQVSYIFNRNVSSMRTYLIYHPLIPVYDIEGNPAATAAPGLYTWSGAQPVTSPWQNRHNGNQRYGIFGDAFAELTLFKDLTIRSVFGVDINQTIGRNFSRITYEYYENSNSNSMTMNQENESSYVWTNTALYSKTLGNHVFKILVGVEAIKDITTTVSGTRLDYTYDLQDDPNFQVLDAGSGTQTNEGNYDRTSLFSYFGRLDYAYADKYIINGTIRRDGSSKFGENNRFGVFPSAAIGWRISAEPFMQNLTWLTDLKLRASYGIIGNQTGLTADNQYTKYTGNDLYSYPVDGLHASLSYVPSTIGNPDAKWERTETQNFGVDLSLLQGRITFTGDYYQRLTDDLLVQNQAPLTGSAATQPSINVGSIRNRGIDLSISTIGTIAGELRYEVTLGFTKYKNKVLKVLDNPQATINAGQTGKGFTISRTEVGMPIAYFYGYKIDGFINSQAELDAYNAQVTSTWLQPAVGRWKIKDVSGPNGVPDNVINDFDRTMIGSPHPDFQANLGLSLNYRNFDFYATAYWNQGGEIFNAQVEMYDFFWANYNRSKDMLYDSWTPENKNAFLPKLDINDSYSNLYPTDHCIEDATYIRLKTIQLGYSLPSNLIGKVGIENLRVYVQGQNLLTYKKSRYPDPDAPYQYGSDLSMGVAVAEDAITPTPLQVIFGVNITL